ncbi:MAG TPA: hypothetical protein VIS29_13850 [Streptomyces sp.]|jgi:hypothetical protein
MPLVLLVLLGAAGCMSVPASTQAPAPVAPVPSRMMSTEPAAVVASASPAVRDVLETVEDTPRKKDRRRSVKHGSPERRYGVVAPSVRAAAHDRPRRYVPTRPRVRGPVMPRRARPYPTYGMGSVCAAGQGFTSGEIADLCRNAFGR